MDKYNELLDYQMEQIVFCYKKEMDLKAVIGIYDTTLGPALGKLVLYGDEETAIRSILSNVPMEEDFISLAKLNYTSGELALLAPYPEWNNEAYWRCLGRYIQSLGGRFWLLVDENVPPEIVPLFTQETSYLLGSYPYQRDVIIKIKSMSMLEIFRVCGKNLWGNTSLEGRTLAIPDPLISPFFSKLIAPFLVQEGIRVINNPQECDFVICSNNFDLEKISDIKTKVIIGGKNPSAEEVIHLPASIVKVSEYLFLEALQQKEDIIYALEKSRKISQVIEEIFDCAKKYNLSPKQAIKQIVADRKKGISTLSYLYLGKKANELYCQSSPDY